MKKCCILISILLVLLCAACDSSISNPNPNPNILDVSAEAPPPPDNPADSPYTDNQDSLDSLRKLTDLAGELIGYISSGVQSLELDYIVGWTLDDITPCKIVSESASIAGGTVARAKSLYDNSHNNKALLIFRSGSYYLRYSDSGEFDMSGLLKRSGDPYRSGEELFNEYIASLDEESAQSILSDEQLVFSMKSDEYWGTGYIYKFFPYNEGNGTKLPIIEHFTQANLEYYKKEAAAYMGDGSVIETQPVGVVLENFDPAEYGIEDGEIFKVTLKPSDIVFKFSGSHMTAEMSGFEVIAIETLQ